MRFRDGSPELTQVRQMRRQRLCDTRLSLVAGLAKREHAFYLRAVRAPTSVVRLS
jgi:hypothetical protein